MTSYVPVIKNGAAGAIFYVGLVSQANTKILQANPTLAAGDVKVSIDGGAAANLGTLPTVTPAAGKQVKVTLSQAEVNGDNITVTFSDAAGAEWCDLIVNIQTAARQIDDLATPTNITAGTITTVTNLTNLPAIPANWLTAAGTAADFTTEIQAGLATPTNITAGTITTVTNLTNLPTIPANWLTAAGTAADFGAEVADAVWDEAIAGHLGAGTTGLALNAAGSAGDPWSTAVPGAYGAGTAGSRIGRIPDVAAGAAGGLFIAGSNAATTVNITGTITTVTNLTNLPAITANWLTAAGTDAGFSAEVADAVWDEAIVGHLAAGSTGNALNAAGAAGDPWTTGLPGAYGAGTAGFILGTNLNATVSSRSSHSAADVWTAATRVLTAGTNIVLAKGTGVTGFNDLSAAQVNTEADAALLDVGLTATITGRIDAAVSTRSSHAAADVWTVATRVLTAGTNIVLAKGVGVTGFNDISTVQVNAEVLDVMVTDTFAEPSSVPDATASLKDMIHYSFTKTRNENRQTASVWTLRNNANTGNIGTATVSDDGTTFTKGEDT